MTQEVQHTADEIVGLQLGDDHELIQEICEDNGPSYPMVDGDGKCLRLADADSVPEDAIPVTWGKGKGKLVAGTDDAFLDPDDCSDDTYFSLGVESWVEHLTELRVELRKATNKYRETHGRCGGIVIKAFLEDVEGFVKGVVEQYSETPYLAKLVKKRLEGAVSDEATVSQPEDWIDADLELPEDEDEQDESVDVVFVNGGYFDVQGQGESDAVNEAACAALVERCQERWPEAMVKVLAEHLRQTEIAAYHQGQNVIDAPDEWYQESWAGIDHEDMEEKDEDEEEEEEKSAPPVEVVNDTSPPAEIEPPAGMGIGLVAGADEDLEVDDDGDIVRKPK